LKSLMQMKEKANELADVGKVTGNELFTQLTR
jgi:hypothetical protein